MGRTQAITAAVANIVKPRGTNPMKCQWRSSRCPTAPASLQVRLSRWSNCGWMNCSERMQRLSTSMKSGIHTSFS
jgi:hypothetical protein